MISADIGHIPIVEEENGNLLLKGVIIRRDITRIYAHKIKEEYKRVM
jgi:CBS domain-containing protein